MNSRLFAVGAIGAALVLAGCQTPGANLASNAYQADQVNTRQAAKIVTILAVMPAKVEVDNTQAKQTAQLVGGILGAALGAVAGNNVGAHSTANSALGMVAGGVVGASAGSLEPGKVLVNGVSITYEDGKRTFNSAQVGKLCQFTPGKAVMVSTSPMDTRIQPNATCPKVASKS